MREAMRGSSEERRLLDEAFLQPPPSVRLFRHDIFGHLLSLEIDTAELFLIMRFHAAFSAG